MTTTREESQIETPSELPAEPKRRVVRRRTVQTDAEGVEAAPAKKPRATRTRKAKVEAEPPAAEPVAEVTAQEADKPKRVDAKPKSLKLLLLFRSKQLRKNNLWRSAVR